MRELDKGLAISLGGPQAEEALSVFRRQVEAWGLAMPPAEPLVLDFGLGDFARVGLVECWIANEVEAGYCGKFLFVFDNQTCPEHAHHTKHETFFVVKGKVRMTLNGAARLMYEGDVLTMPPGARHCFTGLGNALLLEVSMPCHVADNQFTDPTIAAWLGGGTG